MDPDKILIAALVAGILCISPACAWTTNMTVSSGDYSETFTIGIASDASDGFDGYDLPLPPKPPSRVFDAYLKGDGTFNRLQTDVRVTPGWELIVVSDEGIEITWAAPPKALRLNDGTSTVDMTETSTWSLDAGEYSLLISLDSGDTSDTSSGSSSDITTTTTTETTATTTNEAASETAVTTVSTSATAIATITPSPTATPAVKAGAQGTDTTAPPATSTPGFGAVTTSVSFTLIGWLYGMRKRNIIHVNKTNKSIEMRKRRCK